MTSNADSSPIRLPGPEGTPLPETVAILPCDEPIVFPHMIAPMVIREEAPKHLVDEVLRGDRLIGLFPTNLEPPKGEENSLKDGLFRVGTVCTILRMLRIPDGSIRLLVHGVARIRLHDFVRTEPYPIARIERLDDVAGDADVETEALMKQTVDSLQRTTSLTNLPEDLVVAAMNVEDPGKLADLVASNLNFKPHDLREVLAESHAKKRLNLVFGLLSRELHVLEIGSAISEKVRDSMDRNQREFFLREQIKAMQGELGESDPHEQELHELRVRLSAKELPEHAKKVAERELGRLAMLQPAAAEYGVIRTYLDWIVDLPWTERTDDRIDMRAAATILDEDHYGLEKVKERILEYLAVIRLKGGDLKGPILCLVGPPGVGKTSLGRSVARATGRKFTRFSLGGMRDEAEIRGHRRTYIGAMPGRIVKALKDCATINPLIMLDEVDKLGSDFRGDPASALLEVLDPEQNDTFTDHYMDMPVDLSKVMFVTTANTLDTIPGPLRDRMEIIRIAGYTPAEKAEIATRYLIPREVENAGLRKSHIRFGAKAVDHLIREYTAEAGVRALQKQIASICRKVARTIAEQQSDADAAAEVASAKRRRKPAKKAAAPKIKSTSVTPQLIDELIGPPKNYSEVAERMGRPGLAIGLAWTSIGGEILFIEVSRHAGKGNLKLTGQLGDVMKESASAALTWLRSNLGLLGVEDSEFSGYDFHIHVPAGATPKDGPSAGVAMATAIASLVTGRPVRDFVAMTGEITLRGAVLPVGGIKEKCLAAHRAGIKEIWLPKKNEPDIAEVPEQVRRAIAFRFADRADQVLALALQGPAKPGKQPAKRPGRTQTRATRK